MATSIIPTVTDGTENYSITTDLDGVSFDLEFLWNARQQSWSLILSDAGGAQLLRLKLVVGLPLLRRFTNPALPRGELMLVDTTGKDDPPGVTDLGGRVLLTYIEAADLAAA